MKITRNDSIKNSSFRSIARESDSLQAELEEFAYGSIQDPKDSTELIRDNTIDSIEVEENYNGRKNHSLNNSQKQEGEKKDFVHPSESE